MGVNDTSYPRVTIYLKKNHIEFLNDIIAEMRHDETKISRSDLIRAILDHYCDTKTPISRGIYEDFYNRTILGNKDKNHFD